MDPAGANQDWKPAITIRQILLGIQAVEPELRAFSKIHVVCLNIPKPLQTPRLRLVLWSGVFLVSVYTFSDDWSIRACFEYPKW